MQSSFLTPALLAAHHRASCKVGCSLCPVHLPGPSRCLHAPHLRKHLQTKARRPSPTSSPLSLGLRGQAEAPIVPRARTGQGEDAVPSCRTRSRLSAPGSQLQPLKPAARLPPVSSSSARLPRLPAPPALPAAHWLLGRCLRPRSSQVLPAARGGSRTRREGWTSHPAPSAPFLSLLHSHDLESSS